MTPHTVKKPAPAKKAATRRVIRVRAEAIVKQLVSQLRQGKNRVEVEYALRGLDEPISVSPWRTRLTELLSRELEGGLLTIGGIEVGLGKGVGDEE